MPSIDLLPPAGVFAQGLVQGSLAGFNALGFVLLWRVTRVVNLAQPAMGLVGGVLTGMLVVAAGWSFWWAAPAGLAVGALLGWLAERVVLSRLEDVPRVVLLVATVGLAQLFGALQAALPFILGGRRPTYQLDLGFSLYVHPQLLLAPHLLTLFIFPVVVAGLWFFLHRSRLGLAALAYGQDAERARVLGVPANVVRAVAWSIAGLVSAVSGVLSIPVLGHNLEGGTGPTVLLLALAPAVFAGLRSLPYTAVGALGLGVAYQVLLWNTDRAGFADLLLAAAVLAAIAVQGRRFGREAAAARASSWESATTPRPLPWQITRMFGVRTTFGMIGGLVCGAALLAPVFLSPSDDVLYATSVALALGALAVATAWMFAGEVPLGHWGLAGFGAALAAITPGGWTLKVALGGIGVGAGGAVLAAISRRRSNLSFAVLGLAVAAAAPVAVLAVGAGTVPTDPGIVGTAGAAITAAAAVAVWRLRRSLAGARMVAARDDPQRAPWLGASPEITRTAGLGLSGALAGVAGALYLASTPAGLAPGAFDPSRSLDLLAMAVVGGLGSPAGALLGAAMLQGARILLPGPWGLVASGVGVLGVVMFLPGGLGRLLGDARDRLVRLLVGDGGWGRPSGVQSVAPARVAHVPVDGGARIAGSDTREAASTPTVRLAATGAGLGAGVGLACAFGLPKAWAAFPLPDGVGAWMVAAALALLVVTSVISRRLAAILLASGRTRRLPEGTGAAAALATIGAVVAFTGDVQLTAVAVIAGVVLAGWTTGQAARLAAAACIESVRSAATGIVVLGSVLGVVPALHIMLVAGGSGVSRAGAWATAYAVLSAIWLVRARRSLTVDRRRIRAHARVDAAPLPSVEGAMPALVCEGVGVTFGSATVLRSVSLVASVGELVALVGPNGSGKSTLLRVVAGLTIPDTGRVHVGGEDVTSLRPEERTAAGLAFVSGARPVFEDLTVEENLRVGAYRTHPTPHAFAEATDALLEVVPALKDRRGAKAGVLSGGEQRILAVAQTLYRRPAVLLADELTLGLDVDARVAVLDTFRMLADDGICVVVVDHDLPALLPRADRAALLTQGHVESYDDPSELLARRTDLVPATFLASVR